MANLVATPEVRLGATLPRLPAGARCILSDPHRWANRGRPAPAGLAARLSLALEPDWPCVLRGMGAMLGEGGNILHLRTHAAGSLRWRQLPWPPRS